MIRSRICGILLLSFSLALLIPLRVNAGICGVLSTGFCTNDSQCRSNPSDTDFYCDKDLPRTGGSVGVCNSYSGICSQSTLECGWSCGILGGANYGYPGQPGSGTQSYKWTSESSSRLICTHIHTDYTWYTMSTGAQEWRPWNWDTLGTGASCPSINTKALPFEPYINTTTSLHGFQAGPCNNETNPAMTTAGYPYSNKYEVTNPDGWHYLTNESAYETCRTIIDNSPIPGSCSLNNLNLNPPGAYYEDLVQMDVIWNVNYLDNKPSDNNATSTTFTIDSFKPSSTTLRLSNFQGIILGTGEESTDSSPIIFTAYGKGAGTKVGNETVKIDGIVSTFSGEVMCNTSVNIPVGPPPAWWQVRGAADVVVGGNIQTQIPNGCTNRDPGSCRDEFIVEDPEGSGTPGVVVHGGTAVYEISPLSQGNANINSWDANTLESSYVKKYNYNHFIALASGKLINPYDGSVTVLQNNIINNSSKDTDGFTWIKFTGDTTIGNGGINITGGGAVSPKKAVIFVDGNLTVKGGITLGDPTINFVMFVVRGNIILDPSVGKPNSTNTPDMEGVFFTDGKFITSTSGASNDRSLVIRGMVSALGGFSLDRDLGDDNLDSPAEMFIYAPEFMINFPTTLSDKHLTWQEVVP